MDIFERAIERLAEQDKEISTLKAEIEQLKRAQIIKDESWSELYEENAKLKAEANKWRKYHDHQVELKRTLHNEYCKLRKEYMEWKETATSLQTEIAKLKADTMTIRPVSWWVRSRVK